MLELQTLISHLRTKDILLIFLVASGRHGIGLKYNYVDAPNPNNIKRLDLSSKSFERFQQERGRLFAFLFLVAISWP